jgi:predicted DCC family thiol-disulfide oxidoreductase YuxK
MEQDRGRARQVTVWYDGACPLCRREIALMRRLDRKQALDLVDISVPTNACPIDRAEALARFHVSEDGRLLTGASAFAAMWRSVPALRWLGLAARWPVLSWLLERAYRAFLAIRPSLQRLLK